MLFRSRVHQLEGLIRSAHEVGKGKCIVNIDNAERERWFLNWSCPIESMLLSAMSGKDSTVSLVPDEEFDARDTSVLLNENKVMIRRWEIRDNENVLPFFAYRKENYFRLNTIDTVTDPVFFRGKINMDFNMKEPRLFVDRFFFSLQLKNISGQTLSSSPVESCFFKTICERGGDKMESEIPLDADLHTDYVQTISCHELKGKGPMSVTTRLIWRGSELASASRVFDMK